MVQIPPEVLSKMVPRVRTVELYQQIKKLNLNKKVKFKLNLENSEIFNFNRQRKDIVFTPSSHIDMCITKVT